MESKVDDSVPAWCAVQEARYQEEEHPSEARSSVAVHLKGSEEDNGEDNWYQRVKDVTREGG